MSHHQEIQDPIAQPNDLDLLEEEFRRQFEASALEADPLALQRMSARAAAIPEHARSTRRALSWIAGLMLPVAGLVGVIGLHSLGEQSHPTPDVQAVQSNPTRVQPELSEPTRIAAERAGAGNVDRLDDNATASFWMEEPNWSFFSVLDMDEDSIQSLPSEGLLAYLDPPDALDEEPLWR